MSDILLPYQKRWVADQSQVKVCEKSRRIGLTWAEAGDSALLAASKKGMDVWYVGYNKDMAIEFIRDVAKWAADYKLVAAAMQEGVEVFEDGNGEKSILKFTITFASGYRVTALSSRPANLRGKAGRVIIDEAAFHDDLPSLLEAAKALLMWGGQVHVISTHFGVDNPFNAYIDEIRSGKLTDSLHRITLDDALADGLYRRICEVVGRVWTKTAEELWREDLVRTYGEGAEQELMCVPKGGGGKYLSHVLIESRMNPAVPVLRWGKDDAFATWPEHLQKAEAVEWCETHLLPLLLLIPPKSRSFLGEDFGRTGDLSVFAPLVQGQDLVRRIPFLVELRNVPFKVQELILFYLVDRLPIFQGGALDARGNGQYLAEVAGQRYGTLIQQVMLVEGWYRENMPPFKSALEDGTLTDIPKDSEIMDDLRALEVIRGVARLPDTRTVGQGGGKRHGDAAIALALGYFASRQPVVHLEFRAVGQRLPGMGGFMGDHTSGASRRSDVGFGIVPGWRNTRGF